MMMDAQMHEQEMQHEQQKMQMDAAIQAHKQRLFMVQSAMDVQNQQQQNQIETRRSEETHQQALRQNAESSKAKIEQTRAQAKAKPQPKGTTKK